MISHIKNNIYSIYVAIPKSPLRNTNAYLIKGDRRNLLIDPGECREECLNSLLLGLSELDVDMNKTDIFLTHLHPDHAGLVDSIASENTKVFASPIECEHLYDCMDTHITEITASWCSLSGMPREEMESFLAGRREDYFHYDIKTPILPINDGDILNYGGHCLKVIGTPGHTPGHLCLYDEENKVLFSGDHVLFDITPNISDWHGVVDSLGDFVKSLMKVRDLDVLRVLPGHRSAEGLLSERVDILIEHHAARIRELLDVIRQHPGLTAYEISGLMTWNIRSGGGWENFPIMQKPFAVHETCAHLNYLQGRRQIKAQIKNGARHYYFRRILKDDILDLY